MIQKRSILLVSDVCAISILLVAYRSHIAEDAAAPAPVGVQRSKPDAQPQYGRDGLEWFGVRPTVVEHKQDMPPLRDVVMSQALFVRDGDPGDINALQDLMHGYARKGPIFPADPSRAFAYALAHRNVVDMLPLLPIQHRPTDTELAALAATLSPAQVAWARSKAAVIVATRRKET
jgi:hypothetical protein